MDNEKLSGFLKDVNIAGRPESLTEHEGKFILGQSSLDSLRDRILASAQDGNIDLPAWRVRSSLQVRYSHNGNIQYFTLNDKVYLVTDGTPSGHATQVDSPIIRKVSYEKRQELLNQGVVILRPTETGIAASAADDTLMVNQSCRKSSRLSSKIMIRKRAL